MLGDQSASRVYVDSDLNARVRLPSLASAPSQDEEWCEVFEEGAWKQIRFHDYASIYARPGLYEHLFYRLLGCNSPVRVATMLAEVRRETVPSGRHLRVLDLGAGNGMMGAELRRIGAKEVVALDILPAARAAASRDRPDVYDDYLVVDLCQPDARTCARIEGLAPNCLVSVAAMGFGDLPARAFYNALRFLPKGSLLAFTIKSDFLHSRYPYGYAELIRRMLAGNVIDLEAMRRYRHRRSLTGTPLYYTAIVATKLSDVPEGMLVDDP